uniref:RNA-directed RNA polymerase catalytic subunit n=1 Tax=Phasmatodean orthomyxo-related virus OKIAV172 TaxID=2746281 RepID=A0A7D7IPV4_9ORTO|nr:polymerase PB1 [Phasmatodean orthomyxo-related virus OKIAV172]
MDLKTRPPFREMNNSFLVGTLLDKKYQKEVPVLVNTPSDKMTNNLGVISALYIYTNTPPHGYGSQGPKVAETVIRAYNYNLKKRRKSLSLSGYHIERMQWEDGDGDFPVDETHGNFSADDLRNMAKGFLKKYASAIDICVNKTMDKVMHQNSDILTKGRQTLDCFTNQSVTASVAYQRMTDFYYQTLGIRATSCLEWLRCFFLCLDQPIIRVRQVEEKTVQRFIYNKITKQREVKENILRKFSTKTIKGPEEVRKKMMDFSRSFASYIKHKERGKKDRRAIASAGMILRMFLYIIEEFHLLLGREIPGSTISIGGEEKKAKIINNLNESVLPNHGSIIEIQGTEDATKWNECLSPAAFGMMHKIFFDEGIREELDLPAPSENGKLFSMIALSGHFIMAIKRIQMGPGPRAESMDKYNRLHWRNTPLERFNDQTQEWLGPIRHLIDDDNYLSASPGMLMGMLNAGSTTLGLLATGYGLDKLNQQVITLRSSDDSTSIYVGSDVNELIKAIETNRRALGAIGINLSLEKTFFYEKFYSEYTSWYQDQGFVSQFGVETSSIRPQGKNPPDDFYSIAKGTATGLATLTFNHIGADMRIKLGIDGVRRLWRINRDTHKREGVHPDVILLADGGNNMWNSTNCHLEEISLRETKTVTKEDKEYLLRVCNPRNPFCADPSEEISYSKETGKLVTTEVDTPRTVFHYVKRSNRTVQNSIKKTMFNQERINAAASKIIKAVVPTTLVRYPNDSTLISHQILAALSIYRSRVTLTQAQEDEFIKCMQLIKNGPESTNTMDDSYFDDL